MPHDATLSAASRKKQPLIGDFICPTCSKKFRRLFSQLKTKHPFCDLKCKYAYKRPLANRFWEKVSVREQNVCWPWMGATIRYGYGIIDELRSTPNRRVLYAHRISWELHFGKIPDGLSVLHHCDNPPCVNPAHLFLGTMSDNMADMRRKGRHIMGTMFPWAKLTPNKVLQIRNRYALGDITIRELAKQFHVSASNIGLIVRHLAWKHC